MNKMRCPLCCGQTFNTKNELIEHLSDHVEFNCPICQTPYSSISNLLNHLNLTTCRPTDNFNAVTSADTSLNEIAHVEPIKNYNVTIDTPKLEDTQGNSDSNNDDCKYKSDITKEDNELTELQEDTLEDANMYEELLEKDGLQGSDLNLLDENGHNRYTIVTQDGTISITSAKDNQEDASQMKLEDIEPVITVADKDPESNEQEIYSCNTCGVSFSSVLDHIRNYHKDQDVVVEVNEQIQNGDGNESLEEDKETVTEVQPVDSTTPKEESTENAETQTTRRVITDTGDIVETATELIEVAGDTAKSIPLSLLEEQVLDKKGRVFTRRYVQIGKLNRTEPETEEPTQPKVPYHQVVVKEIMTMDGGAKMKVYNCVSCQIYVMNLDEFKSHPCKALKYTCPQCPVSYGNAKSLCAHMKVHKVTRQTFSTKTPAVPPNEIVEPITVHPPESRTLPYKCDVCSTIFPTNKSLKLHKRMHDPIKSRPIEPPVEESSDPTEDSAVKYFCAHCNKWIPVGYRTVHNNFHKSTENFNCDICNKKFTSSSYLLMHMTVHNTDKVKVKKLDKTLPYTCLYCNRQFARPHEKVKHERIHTGEKPHSCEICGKSFRVSYCLTLHMRTHTGARPYACQHCGKRFKAHSVYNHHLLTHSDVRAYKCPYCPKAFKTSVQLAGHKNSHTKPFACEHCNRPFASLYAVRVHTETHRRQNSLKFNCETCGASYARSFALKDHMRQAHQLELRPADAFDGGSSVTLAVEKDWALENTEESTTPAHKEHFQEVSKTRTIRKRNVAYGDSD